MPKCIIKDFEDIECPNFDNPEDACWYDLEYRCDRIDGLGSLNRLIRLARSRMFLKEE